MRGLDRAQYLHLAADDDGTGLDYDWQVIVDEQTGVAYSMFSLVYEPGHDGTIPRYEVAAMIDAGELPQ